MFMRYKGAKSSRKLLPGSSPQGAFLGILLFIIIFNGALLRPAIPKPYSLNLKYIDDLSMLAAFKLKKALVLDQHKSQYLLPASANPLQSQLHSLHSFASQKHLKIKES